MVRYGLMFQALTIALFIASFSRPAYGNPPFALIDSTPNFRFANGQRALKIPFDIDDNGHVFLRVRVNGSEPLWFGFDTGAEGTLISEQKAKALGLKLRGNMKATGSGEGEVDFSVAKGVSFSLPGVKLFYKEVGVLPLEFDSAVPGQTISGLLGYDFIKRFVVEVNFAERVINLYNPRSYRYRGKGQSIPIRMMDNNPYIAATVVLPGLSPVKGMFLLDSGAGQDVAFNRPYVEAHDLLKTAQQTTEAQTAGIGGNSKVRIGRATKIEIGRLSIDNPTVLFSLAEKGDDASPIGAGFIGGRLLQKFQVVIYDQTRKRVILEPPAPR